MPLEAVADRLAPPTSEVAESAALKVPTVLTAACLSTLKSAGRVAAATVPMPSKFCTAGAPVDNEMAAYAMQAQIMSSAAIESILVDTKRSMDGNEKTDFEVRIDALGIILPFP